MMSRAHAIAYVCFNVAAVVSCDGTISSPIDTSQHGSDPVSDHDSDGIPTPPGIHNAGRKPDLTPGTGNPARGETSRSRPNDPKAPTGTSPSPNSATTANDGSDKSRGNSGQPGTSDINPRGGSRGTTTDTDGNTPGLRAGPTGSGGSCPVPSEAQAEDTSHPTTVVGNGAPSSCTSEAFLSAVAHGGVITFNCGSDPVTITLHETARISNSSQRVVIDGGNRVTLSGGGRVRILYQNTCDRQQSWSTGHCDNQDFPKLTVQNLTFENGNASGTGDGGGAIFAQGGRLKVVNSRFYNNTCDHSGDDVGGGAIRAYQQYNDQPLYVVNSTFGGTGRGNTGSNGGALSSIGVSYTVLNSHFSDNRAMGGGLGGNGGAIANDGNTYALNICGSTIENNLANEGGGAIFFVSNDRTGSLSIRDATLRNNPSGKFETANLPGIFALVQGAPSITNSVLH